MDLGHLAQSFEDLGASSAWDSHGMHPGRGEGSQLEGSREGAGGCEGHIPPQILPITHR